MRESNSLFDEEQRAIKLAQRLQEQNDQLLEMLLDVNDSNKIPPYLRYDLRDPIPSESEVPALSPDQDLDDDLNIEQAQLALEEARVELQSKAIDLETYKSLEASLNAIINRPKSLTKLSQTSHSVLHGDKAVPPQDLPTDVAEIAPAGYLSPTHEEDFYATLDRYLDTAKPDAPPMPPTIRPTDRERERDVQLHNPMSVYNWLLKHRADFSTVDKDEEGGGGSKDKPAKGGSEKKKASPKATPAPSRGSKRDRTSAVKDVKIEPAEEMLDDEGVVIGVRGGGGGSGGGGGGGGGTEVNASGGKGKRKRGGEDETYRPKGGTSRPSKRKRASTLKKDDKRDGGEEDV